MDSILETKMQLSEETVAKIIAAETTKALAGMPEFMESMVKNMLFHRPKKQYSSDPEIPTMHEKLLKQYLQPIIEQEISKEAEAWRPKLKVIVKKAFKTNVLDNKEFEDRFLKQLSKFSSNISFYCSDN